MVHIGTEGKNQYIFSSPFFFFFQTPKLNYIWYIRDQIGLMKSIYDFMCKISP